MTLPTEQAQDNTQDWAALYRHMELEKLGFTDERIYSLAEWDKLRGQVMPGGRHSLFSLVGMAALEEYLDADKVEVLHPLPSAPYTVRWRRREHPPEMPMELVT